MHLHIVFNLICCATSTDVAIATAARVPSSDVLHVRNAQSSSYNEGREREVAGALAYAALGLDLLVMGSDRTLIQEPMPCLIF